jgi:hypothetical protein
VSCDDFSERKESAYLNEDTQMPELVVKGERRAAGLAKEKCRYLCVHRRRFFPTRFVKAGTHGRKSITGLPSSRWTSFLAPREIVFLVGICNIRSRIVRHRGCLGASIS